MKALILTMGLALSLNAVAQQTYICTHAESTRIIDVIYKVPGELVPCEVKYTKPTGEQILWSAQAQTGYCEEKAKAFAEKQEGFGWQCKQLADNNGGKLEAIPASTEKSAVETMPVEPISTGSVAEEIMPAEKKSEAAMPTGAKAEEAKSSESMPATMPKNDKVSADKS